MTTRWWFTWKIWRSYGAFNDFFDTVKRITVRFMKNQRM